MAKHTHADAPDAPRRPPADKKRAKIAADKLKRASIAADKLKANWRAGRKSLKAFPKPERGTYEYGEMWPTLEEHGAKYGLSPDGMRKTRNAALLFSEGEIDELCALNLEHVATFGPSHLWDLIPIKDHDRRMELARHAIGHQLTKKELENERDAVDKKHPKHAGRKPRIPDSDREILLKLASLCRTLARYWLDARGELPAQTVKLLGVPVDGLKALEATARKLVARMPAPAATKRTGGRSKRT